MYRKFSLFIFLICFSYQISECEKKLERLVLKYVKHLDFSREKETISKL